MHDWWIALCAKAYGYISYIDKPTMLYRQHSSNVVGSENKLTFISICRRLFGREKRRAAKNTVQSYKTMYVYFLETYQDKIHYADNKSLKALVASFNKCKFSQLYTIFSYGFGTFELRTFIYYLVFS